MIDLKQFVQNGIANLKKKGNGASKKEVKIPTAVGLDIGTSSVKMIRLQFQGGEVKVIDCDVKTSLKDLQLPSDVQCVNTSLSGPSALMRYVHFPRLTEAEVKNALKFEAQKHIPFSVTDLNLDSKILKPDLPNNKMLVLLVAAKKDIVLQRVKLLDEAGLKPGVVDVDGIALMNAFTYSCGADPEIGTKTIALVNIGATFSNLTILEGLVPRLSRDIHIAGNNLNQKIRDVFNVDYRQAEALKQSPDQERAAKIKAIADAVMTDLAGEIRTSFDYFESQSTSTVSKIFITGGGSSGFLSKELLQSLLGIDVQSWDPLQKMTFASDVLAQKCKEQSLVMGVAVGLALRG